MYGRDSKFTKRFAVTSRLSRITFGVVVLLGLGVIANAQDVASEDSPIASSRQVGRKLIMIVAVAPEAHMSAPFLQDIMLSGLEKSRCQCNGKPIVAEIPARFYSDFRRLVGLTQSAPLAGEGKGVLVLPDFSDISEKYPHSYILTIDSPGKYLSSLELEYKDGQKETLSTDDKDRVFRLGLDSKNREQYRIKVPMAPTEYKVTASELGVEEDAVFDGKWPRTISHFAVTFNDFQGNFDEMKVVLLDKDDDPVAEPLEHIQEFTDTRFLLASIGMDPPPPVPPKINGRIDIALLPLRNPGIDHVWIKLPLTEKQLLEELTEWRSYGTGGPVIAKLQKEGPQRVDIGNSPSISVDSVPSWYEIPANSDGSEHKLTFELGESDQQQAVRKKFPKMYMLVVQQNGTRAVSFLKDGVGRAFVDDQLIRDPDVFTAPAKEENDAESTDSN